MRFQGKTVIVTGGSRGIGKAIVERFAAEGARVYFSYNKHAEAAEAVARSAGAVALACNQADGESVERAVERIANECGGIDVLVNNAGITRDQYCMMMPFEQWRAVIDTNLHGAFRWVKACCRGMINARRGAIINVSSVSSLVGIGGQVNYAASKGGLEAFTRALAAELGQKGIRVNGVTPGFIETDMTATMPRQVKRESKERILLKRFGAAEEVAAVVAFLASDEASYIAAQSVVVDGGLTATVV
jgi:3-oxoacyl-[acyl-carrier protein] reductase